MPLHSSEAPVSVRHLRKSFGPQVVLNGIDLHVARGETLAVLGRSGTGKSVLLRLIIGLQKPDSGSIEIYGQEVSSLRLDELNEVRKRIGFLFQQAALYDSLSVEENVAFPLRRHKGLAGRVLRQRVVELLGQVGMEGELSKMPAQISGGMQKRVGLARALALEPDLLLLDEPTAGLDSITAEDINQLIVKLQKQRQTASIVVTHDVRCARTVAGRLVALRDGDVVIEGTFQDLQNSADEFVSRLVH
ncbi:MAG TPA: ATP-binding cassette domain-containing protein [Terriglobales bacterium]|nr:ATP-binding cassette domain-containing protein [Terriglobales bacterium]